MRLPARTITSGFPMARPCFGGEVGEIVVPRQGKGHHQTASGTGEDPFGHQAVRAFGKRRDDEPGAPAPRTSDPVEGLVNPHPDPFTSATTR